MCTALHALACSRVSLGSSGVEVTSLDRRQIRPTRPPVGTFPSISHGLQNKAAASPRLKAVRPVITRRRLQVRALSGGPLPATLATAFPSRLRFALAASAPVAQVPSAVALAVFAIWGLGPVLRTLHSFVQKDRLWEESRVRYLMVNYIRPVVLWAAVMLVCRGLDPITLATEASQAIKERFLNFVRSLATVLAFAFCTLSLTQQIQKLIAEQKGSSSEEARNVGVQFVGNFVYTAVWIAAVCIFMELLGFKTQKWITAGGFGTVLLTLAGRELVTNFLSSIMIHATRPFMVNEWIVTKIDGQEVSGTVEHVGWWEPSIIRGDDREAVHIPNHKFSVSVVRNLSQKTHWRIKTYFGISHLDAVKIGDIVATMRKVVAKHPQLEQKHLHRRVFVEGVNPDNQAIMIMISCFVKTSHFEEYLRVRETVLLDLLKVISYHGARLATPIRSVQRIVDEAEQRASPFRDAGAAAGGQQRAAFFLPEGVSGGAAAAARDYASADPASMSPAVAAAVADAMGPRTADGVAALDVNFRSLGVEPLSPPPPPPPPAEELVPRAAASAASSPVGEPAAAADAKEGGRKQVSRAGSGSSAGAGAPPAVLAAAAGPHVGPAKAGAAHAEVAASPRPAVTRGEPGGKWEDTAAARPADAGVAHAVPGKRAELTAAADGGWGKPSSAAAQGGAGEQPPLPPSPAPLGGKGLLEGLDSLGLNERDITLLGAAFEKPPAKISDGPLASGPYVDLPPQGGKGGEKAATAAAGAAAGDKPPPNEPVHAGRGPSAGPAPLEALQAAAAAAKAAEGQPGSSRPSSRPSGPGAAAQQSGDVVPADRHGQAPPRVPQQQQAAATPPPPPPPPQQQVPLPPLLQARAEGPAHGDSGASGEGRGSESRGPDAHSLPAPPERAERSHVAAAAAASGATPAKGAPGGAAATWAPGKRENLVLEVALDGPKRTLPLEDAPPPSSFGRGERGEAADAPAAQRAKDEVPAAAQSELLSATTSTGSGRDQAER